MKTVLTVCFGVLMVASLAVFVILTRYAIALCLLAMLLAVALDHIVSSLRGRGLSRPWAVTVVITGWVALLALTAFLLIPPLITQAKALASQVPEFLQRARNSPLFQVLTSSLSAPAEPTPQHENSGGPLVNTAARPVLFALGTALSGAAALLTVFFLTVFMLLFGGPLVRRVLEEISRGRREQLERILEKIYKSVGGYIAGLLLVCSANASLTILFLASARVPYFLPLGIVSGFSSLVPYAGPVVAGSVITLLALATGGALKAIATAIYFILYGQLEGHVLGPLVYKRTAHVNPLLSIVSVLFFAELGGIAGAILAVPIVAALQIIAYEVLALRRLPLDASSAEAGPSLPSAKQN